MGVAGCGKSVVGRGLAAALTRPFIDADDLHPRTNIDKMRRGESLNDIDRAPWLTIVHLAGPRALIAERMADRVDHFMPLSLLDDQLATLQPLEPDEVGTTVSIDGPIETVVRRALDKLA